MGGATGRQAGLLPQSYKPLPTTSAEPADHMEDSYTEEEEEDEEVDEAKGAAGLLRRGGGEKDTVDDAGFGSLGFEEVHAEEQRAIHRDFHERRSVAAGGMESPWSLQKEGIPLSLAFSGGGIRASAFQLGVLWRLAEAGCLKDVEYISAVSGGSWAAAAFASHILKEDQPDSKTGHLDQWYLRVVAKTICRMQNNTPYLTRDLSKDPWGMPSDGSSCLPRAFDIPILIGALVLSVVLRPLVLGVLYIIPLVECVEMFFGPTMREMFCQTQAWGDHWVQLWSTKRFDGLLLIFLFATVMAAACRIAGKCRLCKKPGSLPWLWATSGFAVTSRIAYMTVALLLIITSTTYLQTWAFETESRRLDVCRRYVMARSLRFGCHETRISDFRPITQAAWFNQPEVVKFYSRNQSWIVETLPEIEERPGLWINNTNSSVSALVWNAAIDALKARGVLGSLADSMVPMAVLVMLVAAVGLLLFLPYMPSYVLVFLVLMTPFMMVALVASFVQWRVFGPITGQNLFSVYSFGYQRSSWKRLYRTSLVAIMLVLPFLHFFRGWSHKFYRRSLRRAFFACGEEISWKQVRDNAFCPHLLISASATDYLKPGKLLPVNHITFSPLHLGGENLGFIKMKSRMKVSKSMALSGAAHDAIVYARGRDLRMRLLLELLGIGVGENVEFHARAEEAPSALRYLGEEAEASLPAEETSESFYRLPSALLWEMVYSGFLFADILISQHSNCIAGKLIFAASSLLGSLMVGLSFFAFLPCLDWLLHSWTVRTIHMLTGYYHRAERPPGLLYITDGMVYDNTGVLDLLVRHCRRILLVYAGNDPSDEFKFLDKIVEAAASQRIASIYDLQDPRRDIKVAVNRFAKDRSMRHLQLGILYGWDGPPESQKTGRLFILKIRLPMVTALHGGISQSTPAKRLLSEEEILGEAGDTSLSSDDENAPPNVRMKDLSGCCCDCCHRRRMRCGSMFPYPPTQMQFLTPQVASSLCRLGHSLSEEVVELLRKEEEAH